MFAPEGKPLWHRCRVPLSTIDGIVSAQLGTTRVSGNAQPAVFNRQVAMYLAKHVAGWSTTQIGKFYNGRDHSTVCYALKRIEALRAVDAEVDVLLSSLAEEIQSASTETQHIRTTLALNFPAMQGGDVFSEEFLDALAVRIVEKLKLSGAVNGRTAR